MHRIGIDIGGTFTDFAVWNGNPAGYTAIEAFKVPSTPPAFAEAVKQGLRRLLETGRLRRDDPAVIVHGTTVSTNAVIERSFPPLALLVTAGFRDILSIARLRFDRPMDLFSTRPAPLIRRRMVFEIPERLRADGSVDTPLDTAAAVAAARTAHAAGATAIAVCFLHAWRNPAHERTAAAAIRDALPDTPLVLSHEVWPQAQEYERACATLLNACAGGALAGYLAELQSFLADTLPNARLLVSKSNGGMMDAAEATRMPVHTLLSGPAAGVTAAAALGAMLDEPSLLTIDMGGTSTDLSLVQGGQPTISHDGRVGDFPLMMPVTAIEAIGAGGGSIAWLDGPVLKVGPRSAGAVPGPACYGMGGEAVTVSDAYLLCGYLAEAAPLAGGLRLSRCRAEAALRPIAQALDADPTDAAESIVAVATATMLAKALPFIARLGLEPRGLTLLVYGGAGAIHGPLLADELGIGRVIVPRLSSVFCAFGGLVSDLLYDLVRTVHGADADAALIRKGYAALRAEGAAWLAAQAPELAPVFEHAADIRYAGQSFEVHTGIDVATADSGDPAGLAAAFHAQHRRLYGHAEPATPVELLALRLRVRGVLQTPPAKPASPRNLGPLRGQSPQREGEFRIRPVRFNGVWHETPVLHWADLPPGWTGSGPAIVMQETATVLVPPGYTVALGAFGDLIMQRGH